ncbi:hypothetical protein TNCV_5035431 [Trichonephila clavipes]|nr:hypothetical protein TNCV_5035431 [Trichonephila clavipes]
MRTATLKHLNSHLPKLTFHFWVQNKALIWFHASADSVSKKIDRSLYEIRLW